MPIQTHEDSGTMASQTSALSIVHTGNFTEYSLPPQVNPQDLTRGPYSTVYFANSGAPFGSRAVLYQLNDSTGRLTAFTSPAPYETWSGSIISYNTSVTFDVVDHTVAEDAFSFAHVTPTGHYSFTGAPYFEGGGPTNLAFVSNGSAVGFWYGWCIDPCEGGGGVIGPTRIDDPFVPTWVTQGPGGNIYATAANQSVPNPDDTRVYVLSLSGAILHRFSLPIGTSPNGVASQVGIATGPDHNLWITESGLNKIARMTPTGILTQYTIPTANAGAHRIIASADGALWFTETTGNKLGRITTTGSITEYRIPTANAGAFGIIPCTTFCGTHGGVWFTETKANKIGRFNAPI
jgi:hypothetical protein